MADWEVEPSGHAEHLLNDELLNEIFDALEREEIENGLRARYDDDKARLYASIGVEKIRSVRRQLAARAAGKAKPRRTGPAA